jgi:hypothetical protein
LLASESIASYVHVETELLLLLLRRRLLHKSKVVIEWLTRRELALLRGEPTIVAAIA